MAKYVLVWSMLKRLRFDLEPLETGMKSGGQGNVYFPSGQNCIKVLHDPDSSSTQLATIARLLLHSARLYEKVSSVSTVPIEMVWDEQGNKVIGYTMEQLNGWHGLHEIVTETDSEALGMLLIHSGLLLVELCKAIRLIHSQGFVIGDLNPSNVLFKWDKDRFQLKVIDVDSWSVYRSDLGIEFASRVLDTGVIYHPDIIKADRENRPWPRFTPNHDWWAFACISWMVLTKYDPFVIGKIADRDREDRILEGDTSDKAATVKLSPRFGPATQALGPKLRLYLDRCLRCKVAQPFPIQILEDFTRGLRKCNKCGFTAHTSAIICPKCATLL